MRGKAVPHLNVLNLGAGVQSTAVHLLARAGRLPFAIDCSVMGDTQDEPAAVYRHLEWLKGCGGPPAVVATRGRLGHDLVAGVGPSRRFAGIPAFVKRTAGGRKGGRVRRQCAAEYKIEVVERAIRRQLLGLKPGQRVPKGVTVTQHFGISADELRRAGNILLRFGATPGADVRLGPYTVTVPRPRGKASVRRRSSGGRFRPGFPLPELGWSRRDCHAFLAGSRRTPTAARRASTARSRTTGSGRC
jgi:hypothetical protein